MAALRERVSTSRITPIKDRWLAAIDSYNRSLVLDHSEGASFQCCMFDSTFFTLRGGVNQFMKPQCKLDDAHASYAAGLQSGMRISLIFLEGGDVANTPMSEDCASAN